MTQPRTAFIETGEVRQPRKCELLNSCGSVVECTHPEAFDAVPIVCKVEIPADIADALNATDGDETCDKAWLNSVGIFDRMPVEETPDHPFAFISGYNDDEICIQTGMSGFNTHFYEHLTRGQVRMLCAIYKVQLKDTSKP